MSKRCVVNFARGGWYPQGQARLRDRCAELGVDFIGFGPEYPVAIPAYYDARLNREVPEIRWPTHEVTPYAFKAFSIAEAARRGYETVCWMDASAYPQHKLDPIFEEAERNGCWISDNYGHRTGRWSTDECLSFMGLTREEAWETPHCSALVCCFAVNQPHRPLFDGYPLRPPTGFDVWPAYWAIAQDGRALRGPHKLPDYGKPGKSVEGHRHDQTVLSILSHRAGVKFQPNGAGGLDYGRERPEAIVAAYPP